MAQPPRFAARSKILRDLKQDLGARCLYLLLDDIAGQTGEAWPVQAALADWMGVTDRQIRRWLCALIKGQYVEIKRQRLRTRYVLIWIRYRTCTSGVENETGHPCPVDRTPTSHLGGSHLISELRQESEAPAEPVLYRCNACRDTGTKILGGQECRSCDTYLVVRRRKQEAWKRRA